MIDSISPSAFIEWTVIVSRQGENKSIKPEGLGFQLALKGDYSSQWQWWQRTVMGLVRPYPHS